MAESGAVLEKALTAVERELSREEYLEFLRLLTPKFGDTAKELRMIRNRISKIKLRTELKRRGILE